MGSRSDEGVKFVVNFSVEGSGQKDLGNMIDLFKGVEAGTKHASEGLEGMGEHALVATEMFEKLGEAGVGLVEVGVKIFEGWGKTFEILLEKGSEFEQMLIRIRATGKSAEEAQTMMAGAVKIAGQLPITERDATRIVQTMATAHIDGLAKIGESYEELSKKGKTLKGLNEMMGVEQFKKEGPSAVSLFADTLAAAGQLGGANSGMAIHELAELVETGKLGSQMRFGALTMDLRKVGHGAHDAAGRMKLLMKMLEEKGAVGAAQATMDTLEGQLTNIKGILDMVTLAVMEPGKKGGLMDQFVQGLKGLIDTARRFFNPEDLEGQKFLAMLKEVLSVVAGPMLAAMHALQSVAEHLLSFMGNHPGMMMFAAGLSLVAGALTILAGVSLVAAAAIGTFVLVLVTVPEVLLVIPGAIFLVIAAIAALTGVLVVGGLAYEAWKNNWGGIKDFFEDIELVISAVSEALRNWQGETTHISKETYNKLKEHGIASIFLEAVHAIRVAQVWFEGFYHGFQSQTENIKGSWSSAWQQIEDVVTKVGEAIKDVLFAVFGAMGDGQKDVDRAASSAESWGDKAGLLIARIGNFVKDVAKYVDDSLGSVADIINGIATAYEVIGTAWGFLKFMFHGLMGMANEVRTGVAAIVETIYAMGSTTVHTLAAISAASHGDWAGVKAEKESWAKEDYYSHTRSGAQAVRDDVAAAHDDVATMGNASLRADDIRAAAEHVRTTSAAKKFAEDMEKFNVSQGGAASTSGATDIKPSPPVQNHIITHLHNHLYLDGKLIAENTVKHMDNMGDAAGNHQTHS